jgi:hypothetical protein
MIRTKRGVGISAVAFFGWALAGVACGPSISFLSAGTAGAGGTVGSGTAGDAGRAAQGGSAGHGGSADRHGGSAGTSGTSDSGTAAGSLGIAGVPDLTGSAGSLGNAGGAVGAGAATGAGGAPNSCAQLPNDLLLTDFGPTTLMGVADGASWDTGKASLWGRAISLQGGDVFYQGKAASAARATLHDQSLTVTATIEAGDYAGYMFNFAPACTNASTTQGLRFDVLSGSTLGNATLKVQMQQKSDYPSTANPGSRPGDCVPASVATQYGDCLSPSTTVSSSGSTLTAGTVELPWTTFGGGSPVSVLDSSQLMAIQWQFECPSNGGTVSASAGAGSGGASGASGSSAGFGGTGGSGGWSGGGIDCTGPEATAGYCGGTWGTIDCTGANATAGYCSGGGSGIDCTGANATAGYCSGGGSGIDCTGANATAGYCSGGAAGSSGGAGSVGTAGSGGTGSATAPCVVSFTIENVRFY